MAGELSLMEGTLLVDGYNVIHAWPELNKLKDEEMAHARDRLIAIMSEFRALTETKIYLVFDAHQVSGGAERRMVIGGVEVIYTKEGESADNWIERFVANNRKQDRGGKIFVITFDWMEQRVISALGAYRITPAELLRQVERLKAGGRGLCQPRYERDFLDNHLEKGVKQILEEMRRTKDEK